VDPIQKTFLDVWGVPGFLLALSLAAGVWLLRRLLDSQEARIREATDLAEKYGARLQEQTASLRELTAVIHDTLTRMVK
jgi:hypothetical protein